MPRLVFLLSFKGGERCGVAFDTATEHVCRRVLTTGRGARGRRYRYIDRLSTCVCVCGRASTVCIEILPRQVGPVIWPNGVALLSVVLHETDQHVQDALVAAQ